MPLTSAARSIRIRRFPSRSGSQPNCSKASAPICRQRGRNERRAPMTQVEQKLAAAREAIKHVVSDAWIGVGSGSTANLFIDELAKIKGRIKGAVASSEIGRASCRERGEIWE